MGASGRVGFISTKEFGLLLEVYLNCDAELKYPCHIFSIFLDSYRTSKTQNLVQNHKIVAGESVFFII